jgi:triphosphoribosyl-dephospho-CoA synthase
MTMPAVGLCAQLACIWEATARKPGNVHRYQDFDDVTYPDFLAAAAAIAPILDHAVDRRVGETVLRCVEATRDVAATNVNLGIILLLAPLAGVPQGSDLRSGIENVLAALDVADSSDVFAAIRLAAPGGLGRATEQDVRDEPTLPLRQIMSFAAERDLIARQYANGFREVFDDGLPALLQGLENTRSLEGAIIRCHLHLMANYPDTLICRKRNQWDADSAGRWARKVLDEGWPNTGESWETFGMFDSWLRAEGHSRNPGTTADLVAACLFVALREGRIALPSRYPWTLEFPR